MSFSNEYHDGPQMSLARDMSELIVKGKNQFAGNFGVIGAFLRVEAAAQRV
ncbi:MAG: hypothetical protein ACJAXK_000816 [Yoonia sp.]|jgi:hypothetical protein